MLALCSSPALAGRRLSEYSQPSQEDMCTSGLEQMQATMSGAMFDASCAASASIFQTSVASAYAAALPDCTFDYSAFSGVTTCTGYYAAYGTFCQQVGSCTLVGDNSGSLSPCANENPSYTDKDGYPLDFFTEPKKGSATTILRDRELWVADREASTRQRVQDASEYERKALAQARARHEAQTGGGGFFGACCSKRP